jgi:hypothetical protein
MRIAYNILVGKPEGMKPLEGYKHRWEDYIRMDRKELGRDVVNLTHQTQDRVQWRAIVNKVINLLFS